MTLLAQADQFQINIEGGHIQTHTQTTEKIFRIFDLVYEMICFDKCVCRNETLHTSRNSMPLPNRNTPKMVSVSNKLPIVNTLINQTMIQNANVFRLDIFNASFESDFIIFDCFCVLLLTILSFSSSSSSYSTTT